MIRRDFFAALLLATSAVIHPAALRAEPVERFFAGGPYTCGQQVMQTDWHLRGDTTGQLALEVYARDLKHGNNFDSRQWTLARADLSGTLDLPKKNGEPLWRVAGLLSAQPSITALDFRGAARSDCLATFHTVPPASTRYGEVLALLNTPLPGVEQALQVESALERLPPISMLPELEQFRTQQLVVEKTDAFWQRYSKINLSRAEDLNDAALMSDLEMVLIQLAEAGRYDSYRHVDLLASAVAIRSAARLDAGQSVQSDAANTAQFCARNRVMASGRTPWKPYLEAATGVALTGWDAALAEKYLTIAAQCPEGQIFADTVTQHWPEIQKLNQGKTELEAEAARLQGITLTLANAQAENWFQLSDDTIKRYRGQGLTEAEVRDRLEPILADLAKNAVSPLAAEMAAGAAAAPFAALAHLCSDRRMAIDDRDSIAPLLAGVQNACEIEAAQLYQVAGIKAIEVQKANILSIDLTPDLLLSGLVLPIAKLDPDFDSGYAGFSSARDTLNVAIDAANAEVAPKFQLAIDGVQMQLEQLVAAAGPLDHENKVAAACQRVNSNLIPGLKRVEDYCAAELRKIAQAQEVALCDAIWTVTPGPEGFRQGTIAIPFRAEPVSVEKLFCSIGFIESGVTIEDNSGIIFSEFLLTSKKTIGGTPVRFTAILTKPATSGAPWQLTEPKLNDEPLSSPDMKTSADFLNCALRLEWCFRAN